MGGGGESEDEHALIRVALSCGMIMLLYQSMHDAHHRLVDDISKFCLLRPKAMEIFSFIEGK